MKNHLKLVDDNTQDIDDNELRIAAVGVCPSKNHQLIESYISEIFDALNELNIESIDYNIVHHVSRVPIFAQAYAETYKYVMVFAIHFYDETNPSELALFQTVIQNLISVELDIGVSIVPLIYPINEIKALTKENRLHFIANEIEHSINSIAELIDIRMSGLDPEEELDD